MSYFDVILAGFGGQGILMIGDVLAQAAMDEGFHVTWMPAYGVEMRGGTANCTVVISDKKIGSPIPSHPHALVVMNKPSLIKFSPLVMSGGLILFNGSFISLEDIKRNDIQPLRVNANEEAVELGNIRVASMIVLGALVQKTKIVKQESLFKALDVVLPHSKQRFLEINKKALEKGKELVK